jgi:RNA polymerase sigma-70 factor (ECF subfamily)
MQNVQADLTNLPDDELVVMAQRRNNAAFAVLMNRHYQSCSKLAVTILRDPQDAEDEVQNACWKAFEHIGQFNHGARFSTWLTRIVVNQCLMRLRQTKRARFVYIDEPLMEDETKKFELAETGVSPEKELGDREVADVLQSEIRRIPPLLRNVFVLRDVQEMPMEAVADELGISVAAAKSRLLRARQELRNRLEKHFGRRLGAATLLA